MKKLFLAVCLNICLSNSLSAAITPISGFANIKQEIIGDKNNAVREVDRDEFANFLSERIKRGKKVDKEDINRTMGIAESKVERTIRKEKEKGFFQKVYERAIRRINKPSDEKREDIAEDDAVSTEEYMLKDIQKQTDEWSNLSIPVVAAMLPDSATPVNVPAIEHIPYLKNNIEILPNGLVKFKETIVVVANGQKLKSGLTKILPSKVFNKKRKSQNIDYSIINVTINDDPIAYKLAKLGDRVLFVPDKKFRLPAGIYTYKFEYLADNLLLDGNDSYDFYWNVGGYGWNLIVDRSYVELTPPAANVTNSHDAIIGSHAGFYQNSVEYYNKDISYLYKAKLPLYIGTGMHVVSNIDKSAFSSTTIGQKFIRMFYNHGDIYISFLGLFVVAVSFIFSWRAISKGRSRVNVLYGKTSPAIRYMLYGKFDAKSVCGFLLDLYQKNIIDIQQSGETILLVKSTDNLKSLLSYERKALKSIFPAHETTLSITKNNKLPIKRFVQNLEKGIKKALLKFKIKLSIGYLLYNIAMMFVVWAGISAFKINSLYTFFVISATSVFCVLGGTLWYVGNKKWQKYLARYFSVNIMIVSWVIYSAVVHPLAALFFIGGIILMIYSLKLYSGRNGLVAPYINDIIMQKEELVKNKDIISLSKGILKYQSFIFVCDLEEDIRPDKEYDRYKISVIKNIMDRL